MQVSKTKWRIIKLWKRFFSELNHWKWIEEMYIAWLPWIQDNKKYGVTSLCEWVSEWLIWLSGRVGVWFNDVIYFQPLLSHNFSPSTEIWKFELPRDFPRSLRLFWTTSSGYWMLRHTFDNVSSSEGDMVNCVVCIVSVDVPGHLQAQWWPSAGSYTCIWGIGLYRVANTHQT